MHMLRDEIWTAVARRLVGRGFLSSDEPVRFVPEYHRPADAAAAFTDLRASLRSALVDGAPPHPRTAILVEVLQSISVLETVMAPPDRATKKTIRKNAKGAAFIQGVSTKMATGIRAASLFARMKIDPDDLAADHGYG